MLTPLQRLALHKRIRDLELEYFPDYPDQILSDKAVEALITYGEAQKAILKEGWLEKQVKNQCEKHIRNSKDNKSPHAKALAAKIHAKDKAEKRVFDPPRRLKAAVCRHRMTFFISQLPDYQEQKKFYRVAFLALGFEYEAHIDKNDWEKVLNQVKSSGKRSWELAIRAELSNESEHGFMLENIDLNFRHLPAAAKAAPNAPRTQAAL